MWFKKNNKKYNIDNNLLECDSIKKIREKTQQLSDIRINNNFNKFLQEYLRSDYVKFSQDTINELLEVKEFDIMIEKLKHLRNEKELRENLLCEIDKEKQKLGIQ